MTKSRRTASVSPAGRITAAIIEKLEQGTKPWVKPWRGLPLSRPLRSCGTPYRGMNTFWLWMVADACGYASPYWMTYRQAEALGASPLICIVMGTVTACFGGIVRDLLAGQPSILLRREITVTAAILAAGAYVAFKLLGLGNVAAALLAMPLGFALRAGALAWGWSLPSFPARVRAP